MLQLYRCNSDFRPDLTICKSTPPTAAAADGVLLGLLVDGGADEGAFQAGLCQLIVALIKVLLSQDLLRALLRSFGAGLIDLLSPLPSGRDQPDVAVQHGEHPAHTGGAAAGSLRVHDVRLAHAQRGAVIAVLGQNGKVAVDGAADHPFCLTVICVGKAVLCGWVAGLVYRALEKRQTLGCIAAAICAPIVNTGVFAIGMLTVFKPILQDYAGGTDIVYYFFVFFIGVNFLVEFGVNTILSAAIARIVKAVEQSLGKKNQ